MKSILSLLEYVEPWNLRIQHGAVEEARRLGLGMLHDSSFDWSHVKHLPELADGLLLGRNRNPTQWTQGLPWVGTAPPGDQDRMIVPDVGKAVSLAGTHFREHGLTQLACYRNLNPLEPEHEDLEEAFVGQAKEAFLFRNGRHVEPKWTLAGHLRDLEEWVSELPMPVGILCGDEDHATRLLRVLQSMGRKVPEEVSVLAYGIDLGHESGLGLSGIDPDFEEIGAEAVRVLTAMLEGNPLPPFPVRVPPKGVRTGSTTDRRFAGHPLVRRVIQEQERSAYVRQNVEDIAADLGVSKTSLNLAFREATGNSIGEELRRRRLEHAVHLLETTDQRVTEIAFDLGYDQSANFSRDIKMFTGKTPKEVRIQR